MTKAPPKQIYQHLLKFQCLEGENLIFWVKISVLKGQNLLSFSFWSSKLVNIWVFIRSEFGFKGKISQKIQD